ncbi:phytanoyl-CoA dioxygenase family protein [Paraburkholderia sacchari]|uniref:phytanoyl-CoA dioxygenase family protein n=1 Tax=Paraburkholderia sacchari TaxID=159450 RepID=UPI003D9569D3
MLSTEREAFARDGVTVLRGVFTDWVDVLRDGVDFNEKHPGPDFRDYTKGTSSGRFFGDYCNWQRIEPFRRFVEQSPAGRIARELMASKRARIFHEHVLVKEAGADKITPWHHDEPYYCVSAEQSVSMWVPLDPVPRETTLEFVAGSHRWGKLFRPRKFTGVAYDRNTDGLEEMPDIDAHRSDYEIVGWDLKPGDAVAFNYLTVHGAPGNRSGSVSRRVVSFRWLGDNAVYVDRGGETSPPYRHLADRLTPGDPLPEEEFPFVV